jgi:uncharacterized lipoprotein NlpE involved in copper resistance
VKKIFALLAVAALAAVGCDDKKSTNKPSDKTNTPHTTPMTTPETTHAATPATTHAATPATTHAATTKPESKKPDGPGLPDGTKEKDKPKGEGK